MLKTVDVSPQRKPIATDQHSVHLVCVCVCVRALFIGSHESKGGPFFFFSQALPFVQMLQGHNGRLEFFPWHRKCTSNCCTDISSELAKQKDMLTVTLCLCVLPSTGGFKGSLWMKTVMDCRNDASFKRSLSCRRRSHPPPHRGSKSWLLPCHLRVLKALLLRLDLNTAALLVIIIFLIGGE